MLTLYLIALMLGGTLVLATLILGGHGDGALETDLDLDVDVDVDVAAEVDSDAGADADSDAVGAADAILSWLPVSSMRFWTFFLAFFGLTGSILTGFDMLSSSLGIGIIAGMVGYVSGFTVVRALRNLRATSTDSSVSEQDYLGATGVVMIGVHRGALGKVRLALKGRDVELLAETEDELPLVAKQPVMVYAVTAEGHVLVTANSQLTQ